MVGERQREQLEKIVHGFERDQGWVHGNVGWK